MRGGLSLKVFVVLFTMGAILVLASTALAQNAPDVSSQPYKINGKEVKEYLMEKYKLRKDDIGASTDVQQTPNGPKGYLSIMGGDIKPKRIVVTENTVQGRARAIAKAFLEEEATLFGISDMNEIREAKIKTFTGYGGDYTSISYQRYINNIEMENAYIYITIGPSERITSSGAEIVPAPPELYEAVKKKTLTEDEIRKIIEQDLESTNKDLTGMKISKIKKVAIPSPPYVVWTANAGVRSDHGTWGYRIDAFTGEILERGYVVIH